MLPIMNDTGSCFSCSATKCRLSSHAPHLSLQQGIHAPQLCNGDAPLHLEASHIQRLPGRQSRLAPQQRVLIIAVLQRGTELVDL